MIKVVKSEAKEGNLRENERQCREYHDRLLAELNARDPFPHSLQPANESILAGIAEIELAKRYTDKLPEYETASETLKADKANFLFKDNISIGHKIHLNVPLDHVTEVAQYLIHNGYRHKYLSGGEILDGKTFTIYLGSLNKAQEMSQKLSQELHGALRRPVARDEVEYAPNIGGRFVGNLKDFHQYGLYIRGLPMLRDDFKGLDWEIVAGSKEPSPEEIKRLFERAFIRAADMYKNYFYGD